MKCFHSLLLHLRTWRSLAILAAAISVASAFLVACAGPASGTSDKTTAEAKVPKKLSGGELYAVNCSRCHPERYPTEFTPPQWKTLVTHMRVRANLPAAQASEVLKYLQEESGN
jgi:hypothetical protein